MFFKAIYVISFSVFMRLINGLVSFLEKVLMSSTSFKQSIYLMTNLTADNSTPGFWCCILGRILSRMDSHSKESMGKYSEMQSIMQTYPHSVHSLRAVSSFLTRSLSIWQTLWPLASPMACRLAIVLLTTMALPSYSISKSVWINPWSSIISGDTSYSLATVSTAVLRT